MQTKQLTAIFYSIGFIKGLYVHLPLMTVFLLDGGVSASMIVLAGLFYSLGQFLLEIPTGYLADRYGQKLSMILGFVLEGIGLFLIALMPTTLGLILSYLLGGIAAAFLSGSEEALCYENTQEHNQSHIVVYGKFLSMNTLAMMLAGVLGGVAFSLFGLAAAPFLFTVTGSALIFAAGLTFFLKEAGPSRIARAKGIGYLTTVKEGFRYIKTEALLRTIVIVSMFILSGEWVLYNVYQPVFERAEVPLIWYGVALSLGMMVNAIVTANVHRLERRLKLEELLVGISGLIALGYLLFALVPHPAVAVFSVVLILGLADGYRPVLSDYLNERIPQDKRVTILSTIALTQRFASMFMRLVLTVVVTLGGFAATVLTQGIYLLLGACLTWWLLKRCGCTHRIKKHTALILESIR